MFINFNIENLGQAEKTAQEILEHVEEIRRLQKDASWNSVSLSVELSEEKAAN